MPKFRCLIRGEYFSGALIQKQYDVGFYVTRYVESNDANEAETVALSQLRVDPKLALPPGVSPSNQSRVYLESIEAVGTDEVPTMQPGYAWFPMNEDDAENNGITKA